MTTDLFRVGQKVILNAVTDDEDLNDYTEQYGTEVVITYIEDDNFWGVNIEDGVTVPYHMEYRDIAEFTDIFIEEDTLKDMSFEDIEKCSWCGEFYSSSDLTQEKDLGLLCDTCIRAITSRGEELYTEE